MKKFFAVCMFLNSVGAYCESVKLEDIQEINEKIEQLSNEISSLKSEIASLKGRNFEGNNISASETKSNSPKSITYEESQKIMDKVGSLLEDPDDESGQEAKQILTNFINDYPNSTHNGQAHFYLGVMLFREKKYDEAKHHFIKSVSVRPNGAKAAEALYRLSLCLLHKVNGKVSDQNKQMAKKVLNQLVNSGNYAGEFVEKGRKRLNTLGK